MPATPLYQQVAEAIREQIRTGRLAPAAKLPTTEQLLQQHKVGYGTLRTALMELEREGWIEGRQGKGRYVAEHPPV